MPALASHNLTSNGFKLLVRELHFARVVSMSHPCILGFLGTATLGEQTAIVSLYMRNGNLMQYIKRKPKCDKKELVRGIAEPRIQTGGITEKWGQRHQVGEIVDQSTLVVDPFGETLPREVRKVF